MVHGFGVVLVVGLDGAGDGNGEQQNDERERGHAEAAGDVIDGPPHGLIEISAQRIRPEKLHLQRGCAEKRPQDPRELRAEETIAAEPGQQGRGGRRRCGGFRGEQAVQVDVRGDPGEADEERVRHQIGGMGVAAPGESGGGAFHASSSVTGASEPRITPATANAVSRASSDWRKPSPVPSSTPNRPFSSPLHSKRKRHQQRKFHRHIAAHQRIPPIADRESVNRQPGEGGQRHPTHPPRSAAHPASRRPAGSIGAGSWPEELRPIVIRRCGFREKSRESSRRVGA